MEDNVNQKLAQKQFEKFENIINYIPGRQNLSKTTSIKDDLKSYELLVIVVPFPCSSCLKGWPHPGKVTLPMPD
jgi:hypothetical protein